MIDLPGHADGVSEYFAKIGGDMRYRWVSIRKEDLEDCAISIVEPRVINTFIFTSSVTSIGPGMLRTDKTDDGYWRETTYTRSLVNSGI